MNRLPIALLWLLASLVPQAGFAEPQQTAAKNQTALERLSGMTPQERQRWLATLPAQRREEILKKFNEFEILPQTDKQRLAGELERLNNLPQQKQNQVRRALKEMQAVPDDRKLILRKEMDRLSEMPEDERRARMNSEEFRNRYSPAEQQMMATLALILPVRD